MFSVFLDIKTFPNRWNRLVRVLTCFDWLSSSFYKFKSWYSLSFVKQQAIPIWQFFLTLDSFAVKKSFKANSSSAFQLTSTNCTLFGNCSFDDAIVALAHLVAKDPTFSILSSRFSTHNYRRAAEKISLQKFHEFL